MDIESVEIEENIKKIMFETLEWSRNHSKNEIKTIIEIYKFLTDEHRFDSIIMSLYGFDGEELLSYKLLCVDKIIMNYSMYNNYQKKANSISNKKDQDLKYVDEEKNTISDIETRFVSDQEFGISLIIDYYQLELMSNTEKSKLEEYILSIVDKTAVIKYLQEVKWLYSCDDIAEICETLETKISSIDEEDEDEDESSIEEECHYDDEDESSIEEECHYDDEDDLFDNYVEYLETFLSNNSQIVYSEIMEYLTNNFPNLHLQRKFVGHLLSIVYGYLVTEESYEKCFLEESILSTFDKEENDPSKLLYQFYYNEKFLTNVIWILYDQLISQMSVEDYRYESNTLKNKKIYNMLDSTYEIEFEDKYIYHDYSLQDTLICMLESVNHNLSKPVRNSLINQMITESQILSEFLVVYDLNPKNELIYRDAILRFMCGTYIEYKMFKRGNNKENEICKEILSSDASTKTLAQIFDNNYNSIINNYYEYICLPDEIYNSCMNNILFKGLFEKVSLINPLCTIKYDELKENKYQKQKKRKK